MYGNNEGKSRGVYKELEESIVLELKDITKSFGETQVLKGVNLKVHEGEFVTLLGSSGCGKTTTLRIIAGLEQPDSGEVLLEGEVMGDRPPEKRNANMVFQNYALFPHMNVYNNIAYGLKIRGVNKNEIKGRVDEMLSLVQLKGYEKRMPSQMSGGQRQRVAIARALINNPKVLLLDEPLGALDLQLRRQMQLELKRLQKKLGITFIYITHDQEEAINMSDVIAVMRDGKFEQTGSPSEIYDTPKTSYVASFVGSANVLKGEVKDVKDGVVTLSNESGTMCCALPESMQKEKGTEDPLDDSASVDENLFCPGRICTLAIRSESIRLMREGEAKNSLHGTVTEKNFAGGMLRIEVSLPDQTTVVVSRHGINIDFDAGDKVCLTWDAFDAVFVDLDAPLLDKEPSGEEG